MSECKSVSTPLDQNVKLYTGDGSKEADGTLYRQLVECFSFRLFERAFVLCWFPSLISLIVHSLLTILLHSLMN